ncbi:MAG TPA: PLP-dependent transferase [Desulfitobacteriaceae bacterium]|nr:PLP-dependent transferase [Desulfitobacteriaceae bacterium]
MKFNTALLHGNFSGDKTTGATLTPLYQASAFAHQSAEELEDIFNNHAPGFAYTRINNPTVEAFEKRLTFLEGGIGTIACASGMAAIANALLNILKSGDEIVSSPSIFGGTIGLFKDFESFGIKTGYAAETSPESFREKITPDTKVFFVETIGNPKLDVADLRAIAALAHAYNIPFIVDNTAATPFLVKPLSLGADIVIHSSSKYINGSGNSISGAIVDGGTFRWEEDRYPDLARAQKRYGKFAYISKLRSGLFRNLGSCLAPMNAFLNSIGLETLGIRMERICSNALTLAEFLAGNPKISTVNYPGLKGGKWHELAKKQFGGYYGAILTIRAGTKENAFKIINHLKYAVNAANIGDSRTLVIHPASTIYASSTAAEKEDAGVYDDLIRISVGLEDAEDIIRDFSAALDKI